MSICVQPAVLQKHGRPEWLGYLEYLDTHEMTKTRLQSNT